MEWLWTWGGECFGYKDGPGLWTHDGIYVGRFYGDEIYSPDGTYLGEIRNKNRLITKISKRNKKTSAFSPGGNQGSYMPKMDYVGIVLPMGYEDFP